MPKNDLIDDIDYSSLHPAQSTTPAPTKSNIAERQFKKESPKAQAKPIDIQSLKTQATEAKSAVGPVELQPSNLDYVIPGLGILGGLYLLHQNLRSRDLPAIPKQDMRVTPPASPVAPNQPPLPAGLSPQEFDALSPEDKTLVLRGGQNTIAKQTAQQELAQQVSKLQTELASIPQTANPVPVPKEFSAPPVNVAPQNDPTSWANTATVTGDNNSFPVTQTAPNAPIQSANVVSTGPTPEAAAAPIEKADQVKKVTQPTEKPASKAKKPVNPSEVGLTKEQIGMKRYLESFYGGGEIGAKTYGQVGEILGYTPAFEPGKGGGLKPEENQVIKGYRKENIAGPKVNLDKEMKRNLKAGVGVGALMALPGFADAAQRRDYGRMADIASDFAVLPFAGSTELGVSTLGEKQKKAFENAQKLGSPYRSVPPR
jgi:hypothetical protein